MQRYNKIVVTISLLVIWWMCSIYVANDFLVPPPDKTLFALYKNLHNAHFISAILSSIYNLVVAWAISMLLILILVFFSNISNTVRDFIQGMGSIFSPMPSFALMPIMLMVIGINQTTMTAVLVFGMFWMNLSTMIHALDTSKHTWYRHCNNLKLSLMESYVKIYLPAMLVDIISVCKNTWALGWRSLLAIEITFGNLGSGKGLGVTMVMDRTTFNSVDLWASLLVVIIIGSTILLFFDYLVERARKIVA